MIIPWIPQIRLQTETQQTPIKAPKRLQAGLNLDTSFGDLNWIPHVESSFGELFWRDHFERPFNELILLHIHNMAKNHKSGVQVSVDCVKAQCL